MKKQSGFSALIVIVLLLVFAVIGLTAYGVLIKGNNHNTEQNSQADSTLVDNEKSSENSCDTPPVIALPVEPQRIKGVLYPGQVRGNNFKPHGGFILNGSNEVKVTLPLTAKIIDGVRYNEAGEVQYMLDFEADCGYRFRLDHLHTLSSDIQKIADQLPLPTESSQTTKLNSDTFTAGTIVADSVGFIKTGNTSFDFGFYNMNTQNDASKQPSWPTDFRYQTELAIHGTCWFDYLSVSDEDLIRNLPAGDGQQGKNSEYCI